jgi:hypothetical protein
LSGSAAGAEVPAEERAPSGDSSLSITKGSRPPPEEEEEEEELSDDGARHVVDPGEVNNDDSLASDSDEPCGGVDDGADLSSAGSRSQTATGSEGFLFGLRKLKSGNAMASGTIEELPQLLLGVPSDDEVDKKENWSTKAQESANRPKSETDSVEDEVPLETFPQRQIPELSEAVADRCLVSLDSSSPAAASISPMRSGVSSPSPFRHVQTRDPDPSLRPKPGSELTDQRSLDSGAAT